MSEYLEIIFLKSPDDGLVIVYYHLDGQVDNGHDYRIDQREDSW
jgi:hypothetical protein